MANTIDPLKGVGDATMKVRSSALPGALELPIGTVRSIDASVRFSDTRGAVLDPFRPVSVSKSGRPTLLITGPRKEAKLTVVGPVD